MASRLFSPFVYVALSFTLSFVCIAFAAERQYGGKHPGRVLDNQTRSPLSVSIKAWPLSKRSGKDGDCSLYGDAPIDSRTSNAGDGRFELYIDKKHGTYTVTYCASGYWPRDDRDLPNEADGINVVPTPVFMYPKESHTSDSASYRNSIRRRAIASLNNLGYLQKGDSEQFGKVMEELASDVASGSEERAKLIQQFSKLIQAWAE